LSQTSDGYHIPLSFENGPIQLWSFGGGGALFPLPDSTITDRYWTTHISTDLNYVVATQFDTGEIKCWDLTTKLLVAKWDFQTGFASRFALAPRDSQMYILGREKLILADLRTGVAQKNWPFNGWSATCLAASPRRDLLAIGRNDRVIDLVACSDGHIVRSLVGHRGEITKLQFTADGKTLLALDNRGTLQFWQTAQGVDILTWPSTDPIIGFNLSADDNWLAIVHADNIKIVHIPSVDFIAQH
jgi:WD40 repeat protein